MSPNASDLRTLLRAIDRQLRALGTAERRAVAKWYFPTAMKTYGTTVPDQRRIGREARRALKSADADTMWRFTLALLRINYLESRQLAYELLAAHPGAFAALTPARIEILARGMDNWATVDALCCVVAGRAWREGLIDDALIHRWAASRNRWYRRASLACTIPLNMAARGDAGDVPRTLAICRKHVADKDPMVAKALSWALRGIAQVDKPAARRFLSDHADELPALVKREVTTKLKTGLKTPRKSKSAN